MRKMLLTIAVIFLALSSKADEGMWLLKELSQQSIERMQELGFTFPIDKVYDEKEASLKDAIVIFGGGCTGVAVSEQGLIFTNHHCGYGAIQKLSSLEHDYLKNGFAAETMNNELPADGLSVSFLSSTVDVTDEIMSQLSSELSEIQRQLAIDSLSNLMTEKYWNDPFTQARVVPFYAGNKYYKVVYNIFRDVRLVVAPPSSIGKFGGDTDNWMWPRQTGDFSVFRVYADKNNRPAEYSSDNVPYTPKYVVPVSVAGYKEGDYAMTIGYPGSTKRYMTSWGIQRMMDSENKPRIEVRGEKQKIWREAMNNSDAIRIKYASKYSGSSNYWKNSMGMNEALTNLGIVKEKEAIEKELAEWIESNPDAKTKYGNTLASLEEAYTSSSEDAKYTTYFLEAFRNGIEIIRFANTLLEFEPSNTKQEKEEFINERIINSYKDYEPELDKKVLPVMLRLYASRVPEDNLPDIYNVINKKFKGDYEKYADWLFKNSKFVDLENLIVLLQKKDNKDIIKDPVMDLALSVKDKGYEMSEKLMDSYEQTLRAEREFMAALMEMNPDYNYSPDANFTQRLSYGTVQGYEPRDGVWYEYYTTTKGVLEKETPSDPEFNVQPEILAELRKENFEGYANDKGELVTGFLSNNDITGGNSGSPVLNGNAELLGLAFDGNWEALSGDVVFEPEMQRTISVDIRYALYVIDKIMKTPHIIEELELVK
ncbi:MAG TPA: S46 family peptidase [Dysgonamonadaceae bacterium]|nr:S46 family peptidase [Dysgonamonadaceae bacterium]